MAAIMSACRPPPPAPTQIAACSSYAGVTLSDHPKVRSLHLEPEVYGLSGRCYQCARLLAERDLDFVELYREHGPYDLVDRVRLAPLGSANCQKPASRAEWWYSPQRYRFKVPRGQCLIVVEAQTPSAEAKFTNLTEKVAGYSANVLEVRRRDGASLARIVDFRREYVEVRDVTCADVIPGFPRDRYPVMIDHVTAKRKN